MTYTKKMTEGSELKHIILFTLPLFAGNVFQQLYNIVDSIIVGVGQAGGGRYYRFDDVSFQHTVHRAICRRRNTYLAAIRCRNA